MRFKALLALLAAIFFTSAATAQLSAPAVSPAADPENTLLLDLSTGGRVAIQLRPDVAPKTVERVKILARRGFYNGLTFHRVIEGFMAQTGDPKGDGTGGSDLPNLVDEFNGLPHMRGTVAAARTEEPNTANSQFYIMFSPKFGLDSHYTVFGRVVSGMQYVDAIEKGEPPANPSRILQASIAADRVAPPAPQLTVVPASAPPATAAPSVVTVVPGPKAPAPARAPAPKPAAQRRKR